MQCDSLKDFFCLVPQLVTISESDLIGEGVLRGWVVMFQKPILDLPPTLSASCLWIICKILTSAPAPYLPACCHVLHYDDY